MKITKSKLKQIIKEVYDSKAAARGDYDYDAGAGHKAYTDEWGKHTTSDALKHSKKAWFSSHWRDQILQKIEDREPVPPDHVWRRIRRELDAAGIYRPGPEADTLIDKILADMRQQALPHNLKAIPAYWTRPLNENKLTKSKLKQIIKEELQKSVVESNGGGRFPNIIAYLQQSAQCQTDEECDQLAQKHLLGSNAQYTQRFVKELTLALQGN